MKPTGVLTGLASEARILQSIASWSAPPPRIACSGADAARACSEAGRLVATGAAALVSFGLAGGLDPRLRPGDLILPEEVVSASGRALPVAPAAWGARLADLASREGLRVWRGRLAGTPRLLTTPEDKRALARLTGGLAADMESLPLAEAAGRLPLLIVRAVADPAHCALPPAVIGVVDERGHVRPLQVLKKMMRDPSQWGALARLGRSARGGLASLERVARAAGGVLLSPPD